MTDTPQELTLDEKVAKLGAVIEYLNMQQIADRQLVDLLYLTFVQAGMVKMENLRNIPTPPGGTPAADQYRKVFAERVDALRVFIERAEDLRRKSVKTA